MGVSPLALAVSASASTRKAAPSFMPEALPAVTVPSFLNAGRIPASFSAVVPGFGCSSVSKMVSPLRDFSVIGTIWSLKRPSSIAIAARRCDSAANSSCSSRVISHFSARFSAVIPIWPAPKGSVRTETIASIIPVSPMRAPVRIAGAI